MLVVASAFPSQESSRLLSLQARRSLATGESSMAPGSFHGVMELGGASFQITFLPATHDRTGQGQQQEGNDAPVRLPGG